MPLAKSRHRLAPEELDFIQARLTPNLLHYLARSSIEPRRILYGRHALDYYSLCFPIEVDTGTGSIYYFAKCPKSNGSPRERLMPFTQTDSKMARDEYASLRRLEADWHSEERGADFVRAHLFVPEINCIILDLVEGEEFYVAARRYDLLRKRVDDSHPIPIIISRIGQALSNFHGTGLCDRVLDFDLNAKVQRYLGQLLGGGLPEKHAQKVEAAWRGVGTGIARAPGVSTLKGLDIRNILLERSGRGVLIDPGKIKPGHREADLARLIVTLRLLYWGSPYFLLNFRANSSLDARFLASYREREPYSRDLLKLYLVKETMKHWLMGYSALRMKGYPRFLETTLRKGYIDRYFLNEVLRELASDG